MTYISPLPSREAKAICEPFGDQEGSLPTARRTAHTAEGGQHPQPRAHNRGGRTVGPAIGKPLS